VAVLLHASHQTASAVTWHVPGDVSTIQDGLNSASSGDTVLVAPGVYPVDIVFWPDRNGIVLIGSGLGSSTILGDGSLAVLYIASAVPIDSTTVIRGLTFRNGGDAGVIFHGSSPLLDSCRVDSTRNGAGVHAVSQAAPTIRRCWIVDNAGPGVHLENSPAIVAWNNIQRNGQGLAPLLPPAPLHRQAPNRYPFPFIATGRANYGGGVYASGAGTVRFNSIESNHADVFGGGVYAVGSVLIEGNSLLTNRSTFGGGISCTFDATALDNFILLNEADYGGGVYADQQSTVVRNRIIANLGRQYGGGICFNSPYGPATLADNWIEGNTSGSGGGIYATYRAFILRNTVVRNTAGDGGGLYFAGSDASENIVAENVAHQDGGGVYIPGSSGSALLRSQVVRNRAGRNGGGVCAVANLFVTIRSCSVLENVSDGLGDGIFTSACAMDLDSCNIWQNGFGLHNADPFVVPNAQFNWWGSAAGPWHQGYNPAGSGDSLSVYAWDFQPWLSSAVESAPPPLPDKADLAAQGPGSIDLTWDAVPLGDLSGYRIHYDPPAPQPAHAPASGLANATQADPHYANVVDVGNVTAYRLIGLTAGEYHIALTCYDVNGDESWFSRELVVTVEANTDVDGQYPPTMVGMHVGPNPFRSETTIAYALPPGADRVRLGVFDAGGKQVRSHEDRAGVGSGRWVWDGRDSRGKVLPSGVYFMRLQAGRQIVTRRVVLLR
jgi:hypothetical protein